MKKDEGVLELVRQCIRTLRGYPGVRPEGHSHGSILMDANENPYNAIPSGLFGSFGENYNRYPESQPEALCDLLRRLFGCDADQLLVTHGSGEGIDLLVRVFCDAGRDSIMIMPPTFSLYKLAADIHGADTVTLPITHGMNDDELKAGILSTWKPGVKLVFLCRPNNPLGTNVSLETVGALCTQLSGKAMVVCDEAYVDFSAEPSATGLLREHPNLVVLRTLSKAWGLAGVRIGAVLSSPELRNEIRKVQPTYPVGRPSIDVVMHTMTPQGIARCRQQITEAVAERERLAHGLRQTAVVKKVYPSEANFLMILVDDSKEFCADLERQGVVVRNRGDMVPGGVRISIGTRQENDFLLGILGVNLSPEGEAAPGANGSSVGARQGVVSRRSSETTVEVTVDLDRPSPPEVCTGVPFFDHMLQQIGVHGGFGLKINASGDLYVDAHHTVEDVALALGDALNKALGNREGINRYGFVLPMDEARAEVLLDLSGRPVSVFHGDFPEERVGAFACGLCPHFFRSLSVGLGATVHVDVRGEDSHHMIESAFKALGRALGTAVAPSGHEGVPSSKGMI